MHKRRFGHVIQHTSGYILFWPFTYGILDCKNLYECSTPYALG